MDLKSTIFIMFCIGTTYCAQAQHEGHVTVKKDTIAQNHGDAKATDHTVHDMKDMPEGPPMTHSYSLNLPMTRNGSGTAWLPDASPMYALMIHKKKWMFMLHGNLALRYTKQDVADKGSRGDEQFDAPNWVMFMGQRKVGAKGLFHFSAMISLDRLTEGGAGYPLLFQSGESWNKEPLVDRQHPHDLFSELSASYTYALSERSDLTAYFGYPGEPALGSVAFMHRPSALSNPDAPISHHWNDGTHITFGVATLGYRYDKFKIEGSVFTGQEPDENRYNFDKATFDSYSARLSYNPNKNWALQISHGWIKSPEAFHEQEDVQRGIISAIYALPIGEHHSLNATALWGRNKTKGHDAENAALLEATYQFYKTSIYTRYEWVQKSADELHLDHEEFGEQVFGVHALTLGFNRDILDLNKFNAAIGAQLSFYAFNSNLDGLYGSNPVSGQVFIRFYPKLFKGH